MAAPTVEKVGDTGAVLWVPPVDARANTRMGVYLQWLEEQRGRTFGGYHDLWDWSTSDLEGFWRSIWDHFAPVRFAEPAAILDDAPMPQTAWFTGARVNYAAQALRHADAATAVIAHSQTRDPVELTFQELREQVAACAAGLRDLGIGPGDRVVAYLPNIPEALVVFLASASLGAVFSSCPPEFGTPSVVDRFKQIDPKVMFAVDGYRYGDKDVDRAAAVAEIRRALPSLEATVVIPYLGTGGIGDALTYQDLVKDRDEPLVYAEVPFDHPLYVLYSSGTTGLPKAIVHGHGGIMIEHLKTLGLHLDLGSQDRFFWFSTTGWMVWNFLVSGLLVGAAVVLYDGNPAHPDLTTLWRLAADTRSTYLGLSAPFIVNCMKAGLEPGQDFDLSTVRGVGSTGAPLPPSGFQWVYDHVSSDVVLGSASGGTDVCTAFVGACPLLPVYAGEIPCRLLGARVEAYDERGRPVIDQVGELVVTRPMPSMPVGFWGDPDGQLYRAAYFESFPGAWRHGDWIQISSGGTCLITGRSDATLNRGGVRMGTGDFYALLDTMPEIADALVVHLEDGPSGRLVLLVEVARQGVLDDALVRHLRTTIKDGLSPRHIPDEILQIPVIPRTLTGKRLELPVKRILEGARVEDVVSPGSLQDPRAVTAIVELAAVLT